MRTPIIAALLAIGIAAGAHAQDPAPAAPPPASGTDITTAPPPATASEPAAAPSDANAPSAMMAAPGATDNAMTNTTSTGDQTTTKTKKKAKRKPQ